MIAAASDAVWDNRAACGRMYSIMCTGANNEAPYPCTGTTITVKVVDYCPNCNGTFDLSREAFLKVSTNLDVGNIKIDYNQ
jgi:expansin (peptidoglycan-binding protein)